MRFKATSRYKGTLYRRNTLNRRKIAADKVLIEAGTYVIPTANQTDQTAKTAWVQGAVDALIVNGTVATVTFSVDTYSVALKSNEATGTATITVTEEV